jgi:hypothetical protein
LALLLITILIIAGCSNGEENGNSPSEPEASSELSTMENGVDLSEELELTMYLNVKEEPEKPESFSV